MDKKKQTKFYYCMDYILDYCMDYILVWYYYYGTFLFVILNYDNIYHYYYYHKKKSYKRAGQNEGFCAPKYQYSVSCEKLAFCCFALFKQKPEN